MTISITLLGYELHIVLGRSASPELERQITEALTLWTGSEEGGLHG